MSNVAFLLIVVVVTVVGSLALWVRHRKPTTYISSVEEFQREMRALSRDPNQAPLNGRRVKDVAEAATPAPRRFPIARPARGRSRPEGSDEPTRSS